MITEQKEDEDRGELDEDEAIFSTIETEDDTMLESILRDSLIKSFMVIFTHDHS